MLVASHLEQNPGEIGRWRIMCGVVVIVKHDALIITPCKKSMPKGTSNQFRYKKK
jgi:hypothetical protein